MISVLFNRGKVDGGGGNAESAFVQSVFDAIDHHQEYDRKHPKKVTVNEFFEELRFEDYWNYRGSVTTPPCTEGIEWIILKEIQTVSDLQMHRF